MGRADDRSRGRLRSWPSGHTGWVFSGVSTFQAGATTFLAQGAARGERQMFLADDPVVGQWPNDLVDRGELVIASVTDIYGPDRMVAATFQRETFATALAEALSEGYTGIRVAADNSSLIDTPERLQAWLAWEEVADRFMAENPVTGLCAFDRTRIEAATLSEVVGSHHVSMSD
jgi:MEDS: MEthanogen/methylotroph, DcmR Sensory domain